MNQFTCLGMKIYILCFILMYVNLCTDNNNCVIAASNEIQYSNAQDVVLQLKHTMGRAKVAAERGPLHTDEALKYIGKMHVILKKWGKYLKDDRDGLNSDGTKKEGKNIKDELIDVSINATYVPEGCTRITVEGSKVKVHYVGKRLRDNKVFDSSFHTGSMPYRFIIGSDDAKVEGWNEAVLGMCKGERRNILLPYTKGYGEKGTNGVPPFSNLKYTIELVEFSGPSGTRDPAPANEDDKKEEEEVVADAATTIDAGSDMKMKKKKKKKKRKKKKKKKKKKTEL